MDSINHTLHAIVRQLALLGWHVKQLRDDSVATLEIDGGIAAIKDALADLDDDLDDYYKTRDKVRQIHNLGMVQSAIDAEREEAEAMAAEADARSY